MTRTALSDKKDCAMLRSYLRIQRGFILGDMRDALHVGRFSPEGAAFYARRLVELAGVYRQAAGECERWAADEEARRAKC